MTSKKKAQSGMWNRKAIRC